MLRRIQPRAAARGAIAAHAAGFSHRPTDSTAAPSDVTRTARPIAGARPLGLVPVPTPYVVGGATRVSRRTFLDSVFRSKQAQVKVDTVTFDKETPRYRGTLFGFPADDVVFYAKVTAGAVTVMAVFYTFFKGYAFLSRFSLQAVARLGFFAGFASCMIIYTTAIQLVRRSKINANAVYNQSIALVMRNEKVQQFLGSHPRTGAFKTYSATGGFKLPLLRRIRSGSYELSDLLGLKPRRLQMLFILKNPATNNEGIVACDVRRETTGFLSSTNVYKSLSITLKDRTSKSEPEMIILIGKPEDVVYSSLVK